MVRRVRRTSGRSGSRTHVSRRIGTKCPYVAQPIAVEIRVLWKHATIEAAEEWIPAVAVRWSASHVCVHVTDTRSYWPEFWVAAADVRRRER